MPRLGERHADGLRGARVLVGPFDLAGAVRTRLRRGRGERHPEHRQRGGGIPEAVGDGGILIDEIFDADRWVAALRQLQDPTAYATYSYRARQHALRFAAGPTVAAFLHAVRGAMGIDL